MSLKSISTKKKKTQRFARRPKTGLAAAPVTSFQDFNYYIRNECDNKEISTTIKNYIKEIFPKNEASYLITHNPEWMFYHPVWIASSILWLKKEFPLPDNWNFTRAWDEYVENLKKKAEENYVETDDKDTPEVVRKSPTEIIKEKTNDYLGENVEGLIDDFIAGKHDGKFSMFNELKKVEASAQMARNIKDVYTPLQADLQELVDLPTASQQDDMQSQLAEGYSFMSKPQQKKFLAFITEIINDCDNFLNTKKATRKTRVKKPRTADKQVAKLKYKKEDNEYKLASIDPMSIPGSFRLYVFNTKNRTLSELVTIKADGLEVKGTTIQGIDVEQSRSTKLRKPEDFLKIVLKKTPLQINKEWSNLTTKTTAANGRINEDTILLRVVDK